MCEATDGLKLCTCRTDTAAEPDWILECRDLKRGEQQRRGRALRPRFNGREQLCIDTLIETLAAGDCFDFDYEPREGDVLRLRVRLQPDTAQRRSVRFRFLAGRWTHDQSIALAGWRVQMVESRRGRID